MAGPFFYGTIENSRMPIFFVFRVIVSRSKGATCIRCGPFIGKNQASHSGMHAVWGDAHKNGPKPRLGANHQHKSAERSGPTPRRPRHAAERLVTSGIAGLPHDKGIDRHCPPSAAGKRFFGVTGILFRRRRYLHAAARSMVAWSRGSNQRVAAAGETIWQPGD